MTDRQSQMNRNNIDSSTTPINRDERHPLKEDQNITIDNNTLNNIINSIIPTNDNNSMQQYLLPVDLLVSVDKSNKPTLCAAIPSSFAFQQQLPLQLSPLHQIPPLPPTYPSYPSYPTYPTPPTYPTYPIYQTHGITQIPPISQPVTTPQLLQSSQPQQSTLNPSAATFTPFTPFTVIEPILEQQPNEENEDNQDNTAWVDIDDKMEEKHDNDNNNNDEWCIYDDIEQQKQQKITSSSSQTVDSTSSKSPKHESISKQTTYSAPFKRKPRYFNNYGNNDTDNTRQYDKNWRNHDKINRISKISKSERLLVDFVRHVTLPNRERYPQNTILRKIWMMKNIGEIEWGYNVELVYCKGDKTLSLYHRYPVMNAKPGQQIKIFATIKTSKVPGRYCTYFRLQKNGKFFGPRVWCDIIVANSNENVLDKRTNSLKCATQNNQNQNEMDENDKPIKWKKKYGTKNEAHNHYKVVSCK